MPWQLAQLNIARWAVDAAGPVAATFLEQLDEVNRLGEAADGFVWRLQDESGDATDIPTPWGPSHIANLTVWRDLASLRAFVYRDRHVRVMRDRRRWFVVERVPTTVLWWVPTGHRPTLVEGEERLALLRADGPGPAAFGLRDDVPPPVGVTA